MFGIGDSDFAPVHQQGIVAVALRHLVDVAVAFGQVLLAVPAAFLKCPDITRAGKVSHPFVQQGVGIGFADKEEIHLLLLDRLTKRRVAIPIIAQQGDATGRIMDTPSG